MRAVPPARIVGALAALVAAFAGFALILSARGGGAGTSPTPTAIVPTPAPATATTTATATATVRPTVTPTTTPTLRTYPADTRTNIPAVDAVIEAVLAGDVAALEALMYWAPVPCEMEMGPQIACEPGEPGGTIVEGFLMGECQGDWKRRTEIGDVLRQMVEGAPTLYAVFRAEEVPQFLLPPYGHGVVFLAPDHRGRTVRVTDEGIVALFLGCKPDPREALMKQYNLVLPPLE